MIKQSLVRVGGVAAVLCTLLYLVAAAGAASPQVSNAETTIVYISADARELRLIQPDGSNDRLLWRVPESVIGSPIESVMWRPDAQQIAFGSMHEATCSEYAADIYLINPDGSNLRRLTNGPACGELAAYPQGSATVQVQNLLAGTSEYLVYIEGAPTAKVVTIAPGDTVLVSFPMVADLGPGVLQAAVASSGTTRWFDAGVAADISAGENSHAGLLSISGGGFPAYGVTQVSWSPDGSRLAYQFGQGRLWQVGVDAPLLSEGEALLDPQVNSQVVGVYPVWSPVSNEVLYQRSNTSPFTINRAEVGGDNPGLALVNLTNTSGIAWLSDGSGMVVADYSDLVLSRVDLYLMTFADNQISKLTQASERQGSFLPGSSPDSSQIVYVYTEDIFAVPFHGQLRIMDIDGSNDHLLVEGGRRASWSRVAVQNPTATPTATNEPTATATAPATTQPTATSQPPASVTPTATTQPVETGQPTATATTEPGVTSTPQVTPSLTPIPGSTPTYRNLLPLVRRSD
jgi:Tol biopolymer transport system component